MLSCGKKLLGLNFNISIVTPIKKPAWIKNKSYWLQKENETKLSLVIIYKQKINYLKCNAFKCYFLFKFNH